jgi:hypothetical protein
VTRDNDDDDNNNNNNNNNNIINPKKKMERDTPTLEAGTGDSPNL